MIQAEREKIDRVIKSAKRKYGSLSNVKVSIVFRRQLQILN
jgi:hypothetical protein